MDREATAEPRFVLSVNESGRPARLVRVGGKVSVGRSKKSDLCLDDPRVSLKHAELTIEGGIVRASDLGSTNGTFFVKLEREGFAAPRRIDPAVPAVMRQGDELRVGDPEGPRLSLELEPLVLGEIEEQDEATAPPPKAASLAKLLARVDVDGIVEALASVAFETFPEVENVIVWGPSGDEPIYAARRADPRDVAPGTKPAFARLAHAPPFSRTVLARVRSGGGTVVFGTPLPPTIDSESLRHAQILAGFCAPLVDGAGRVVGVLEADSRRRNWAPQESTLREIARVARFAGRLAAVALEAEAARGKVEALAREGERLRRELGSRAGLLGIVGRDRRVREQLEILERVAPLDAPVLITGETGTGKELFARALHDRSPRARGPFVAVSCASLPEPLLESELFGFERGAFTGAERATPGLFERAQSGTLFLDEIGEAPLDLQATLLRAIERKEVRRLGARDTRTVDVRIVAATNRDLEREVAQGRFRRDLLFRLNAIPIKVPPLRERRGDIPDLVEHFLADLRVRLGRPNLQVAPDAMRLLLEDPWTGNVRELENRLLRAAVMSDDGTIRAPEVAAVGSPPAAAAQEPIMPLREARDAFLRTHVTRALIAARGNRREAARILAMDASNLARTMKRLGMLEPKEAAEVEDGPEDA